MSTATAQSREIAIVRLVTACYLDVDIDETSYCAQCYKVCLIETKLDVQGLYNTCSECGARLPD